MISKTASILYLFDFDGTLCGQNKWQSYFKNNLACLKTCYFNPAIFGIRWCILTGRPKIDYLFIKLMCKKYKLTPQQIFTVPTLFYHFNNPMDSYKFKIDFMKKIINDGEKSVITYTPFQIQKIFYIDNEEECVSYINNHRDGFPILSMSVADFYKGEFNTALLP